MLFPVGATCFSIGFCVAMAYHSYLSGAPRRYVVAQIALTMLGVLWLVAVLGRVAG